MTRFKTGLRNYQLGKIDGIVYQRVHTHAGIKIIQHIYVKPSNPRTPAQVLTRNRFIYAKRFWNSFKQMGVARDFEKLNNELPAYTSVISQLMSHMLPDGTMTEMGIFGNFQYPFKTTLIVNADMNGNLTYSMTFHPSPEYSNKFRAFVYKFNTVPGQPIFHVSRGVYANLFEGGYFTNPSNFPMQFIAWFGRQTTPPSRLKPIFLSTIINLGETKIIEYGN